MQLTYRFNYKGKHLPQILKDCVEAKNLYNQAQYWVRNNFIHHKTYVGYMDTDEYMRNKTNLNGEINYYKLKSQTSQQILKNLDKNWKSFFASIKNWKNNKHKYNGMPKLPSYKNKYSNLYFTNQNSKIKDGYLFLDKETSIKIPQPEQVKGSYAQCRIIPHDRYVTIEIIYNYNPVDILLNKDNILSIDTGVNNLLACIDNINGAFLVNGKHLKSYNKNFNKNLSKAKSLLPFKKGKQKCSSKLIQNMFEKRNNYFLDKLHKVSSYIVNYCMQNDIGTIIIGQNLGWKQESTMSKQVNQTFCQIPHSKLINMLKYKCEKTGIKLITTQENHTSKCDSLALEPIHHHEEYSGRRIQRGLFKSSVGKLINADINGAINIARKVVGDVVVKPIIDMGLWCNPRILTV